MNIALTDGGSTKQFEDMLNSEMKKYLDHFEKELSKLRTGKAHPSMVEDLKVQVYGSITSLKEIAGISAPESALLVIQPWDKSVINDIEKAIQSSDLGINPTSDGKVIRLVIPPMTATRRQELTKVIAQKLESCKVAIRNVRKDSQNKIREAERSKSISEDYGKKLQDVLQKVTNKYIELSDKDAEKKAADIKS